MKISLTNSQTLEMPVAQAHLIDKGYEILRQMAPSWSYPAGTELFRQGCDAQDVCLLDHGMAKLTYCDKEGQEFITGLRLRGDVLGVSSIILRQAYPVSAITLTPCQVRRIPADKFQQEINANISVLHYLLRSLIRKTLDQEARLIGFGLPARGRLERLLAQIIRASGDTNSTGVRPLPSFLKQWEIAQLIGVTPQHLSRLFKEMLKEGALRRENGRMIIAHLKDLL